MEETKKSLVGTFYFIVGAPLVTMGFCAVYWFIYLAMRVMMFLMVAAVFLALLAAPVYVFVGLLKRAEKVGETFQFVAGISGSAVLMCGYYALFYHFQRSYLPLELTPERFVMMMLSGC